MLKLMLKFTKTTKPINLKTVGPWVVYRMQYYDVNTNPRWRTAANVKIVMQAYFSEKRSGYDEIRYTTSDRHLENRYHHIICQWNTIRFRWNFCMLDYNETYVSKPQTFKIRYKLQTDAIFENTFLAISKLRKGLSDLREILYEHTKSDHNDGRRQKNLNFDNSRWRTDLHRNVSYADAIICC